MLIFVQALVELVEELVIRNDSGRRCSAFNDQRTQLLSVSILADQVSDVFAAGLETALRYLLIDIGLERIRQGNVHVAHGVRLCDPAAADKQRRQPTLVSDRPGREVLSRMILEHLLVQVDAEARRRW